MRALPVGGRRLDRLPTPLVRAVLDAGVRLYPANDEDRLRQRDAVVAAVEARRKPRKGRR